MQISSSAITDGEPIPERHTCEGEDVSPLLELAATPAAARALAIIVDDPDAPGGTFVHWLIWNLPSNLAEIPEGVSQDEVAGDLGEAVQGENDFGEIGYRGPCPPPGDGDHRYRFTVYALDAELDLEPGADRDELDEAMEGHVLGTAQISGVFSR